MGIQQSNGHNCTGVLIEVDSNELARFDERERGYDRIEVDLKHIFPHDEDADDHLVIRKAHQKRKVVKDSAQDGHDEIIIKSNDHHDNSRVRIRDIGVNTSTLPRFGYICHRMAATVQIITIPSCNLISILY
jgi:hypothetical protein